VSRLLEAPALLLVEDEILLHEILTIELAETPAAPYPP
jgi:hypothetical protein